MYITQVGKTYKIVRDIDFEGFIGNPVTYNMQLKSNFEGNNMEIRNYSIYKNDTVNYIGLFKSIKGVNVRNLILKPQSIKATNSFAVGGLAGEIDGARLYNITIDKSDLLKFIIISSNLQYDKCHTST